MYFPPSRWVSSFLKVQTWVVVFCTSHSLQIRNVDVFSLSPMLLGHNSFPHILQSGNVTSFSFGKPKNVFFEAKSRAKIQRMTGGG